MATDNARRDLVAVAAGWFCAALTLYLVTAARGLIWADSSKLTLYAVKAYLPSLNPGDHAGWTLLAWTWLKLWGGDPVIWAHRLSALSGAFVVALGAAWVRARSDDAARANSTAALLLVAFPLWWASAVAETYAPAMALALAGALVLRLGRRAWRWWVAGALLGLALAVHALSVFLIVPFVWVEAGRKLWRLAPGVAVGLAPAWLAVFGGPVDPMTGFAASGAATWGWHWAAFVDMLRAPRQTALVGALLLYSVGPVGLIALLRRRERGCPEPVWMVCLGALGVLLVSYAPYRLHVMVGLLVVGVLLGVRPRLSPGWRLAHVGFQALLYLAVPAGLTALGRSTLGIRLLPHRNNAFYFLCPIKSLAAGPQFPPPAARAPDYAESLTSRGLRSLDAGAERYLAELDICMPARSLVLADFNPGAVLRLAQEVRAWRRDIEVRPVAVDVAMASPDPAAALSAEVSRELPLRPVILADTFEPYYRTHELAARFKLVPCGPCIRIRSAGDSTLPSR